MTMSPLRLLWTAWTTFLLLTLELLFPWKQCSTEVTALVSPTKRNKIKAAVLVPGFLTGAKEFEPLCNKLTKLGLPTVAVPMPNWHWIPCLGGRSARPILERIDFTVQHLIANNGDISKIPKWEYSVNDCWNDFWTNPGGILKVGGSDLVDEYPIVEPCGKFVLPTATSNDNNDDDNSLSLLSNSQIALIGHSAGGWISRAYITDRSYGGKSYNGKQYIHSLVTLGTPHNIARNPAFRGIEWCNREPTPVPTLAVAGSGYKGDEWGSLTLNSYSFCCPDGSDGSSYVGDGVTPTFSALACPGAQQLVIENVTHFCWPDVFGGDLVAPELTKEYKDNQRLWYGSDGVIDQWVNWILDNLD